MDSAHAVLTWIGLFAFPCAIVVAFYLLIRNRIEKPTIVLGLVLIMALFLALHEKVEFESIETPLLKAKMRQIEEDAEVIAKVRKEVEELKDELIAKIEVMEASSEMADLEIRYNQQSFEELNNLIQASLRATHGSRAALDHLQSLSMNEEYPSRDLAQAIYDGIVKRQHSMFVMGDPKLDWMEPSQLREMGVEDFLNLYKEEVDTKRRLSIIEYVTGNTGWSNEDTIAFLIGVLKSDSNLESLERAGLHLNIRIGGRYYPLEYLKMLEWWENERVKASASQSEKSD